MFILLLLFLITETQDELLGQGAFALEALHLSAASFSWR